MKQETHFLQRNAGNAFASLLQGVIERGHEVRLQNRLSQDFRPPLDYIFDSPAYWLLGRSRRKRAGLNQMGDDLFSEAVHLPDVSETDRADARIFVRGKDCLESRFEIRRGRYGYILRAPWKLSRYNKPRIVVRRFRRGVAQKGCLPDEVICFGNNRSEERR